MKVIHMFFSLMLIFLVLLLSGCQFIGTELENEPPKIKECKFDYFDKQSSPIVYFFGFAVDNDGEITRYSWTISDGFKTDKQSFSHTFKKPGVYYATLNVMDNNGAESTQVLEIEVFSQ